MAERIGYTIRAWTTSGPMYLEMRRGTAESRRKVFDNLRALRADKTLHDLNIWRSPWHWINHG